MSARIAGRVPELATVRRHLASGEPRLLLVTGEVGIGKTQLVVTASAVASDHVFVAGGTCLPLSTEVPLLPVASVVRATHDVDKGQWLQEALTDAAPYVSASLRRLLPELDLIVEVPVEPDDEWSRQRLFTAVGSTLRGLAALRPLAVLVEDLHWADAMTLDLLEHLLTTGLGVPVVGTWRKDDPTVPVVTLEWREPIRRYEHERPGDLIHVDVKKLGKVPDGGGWRYVGRQQGERNRSATVARTGAPRSRHRGPLIETCYLHTVIDDHSRVAYVEAHEDETKETATEVLRNAVAWFAARGVTVQRVLSDNGSAYKSRLWRQTCAELDIAVKKTRPYRPQTNGKIERFHRTLAEGWAFKKFYHSESARLAALPAWIHEYNHHRPHSAIGKCSPITRLDNLAGHHT